MSMVQTFSIRSMMSSMSRQGGAAPAAGPGTAPSGFWPDGGPLNELNVSRINPALGPAEADGNAGWKPLDALEQTLGAPAGGLATLLSSDTSVTELSSSMVKELNNMYSYVQKLVLRERSRHDSSVSLMMRKIDKDLKDTFASVRGIFSLLSEQLVVLLKEVETSRVQLKSINERYNSVRAKSEAQAVYVLELEEVLNGQGVSDSAAKPRTLLSAHTPGPSGAASGGSEDSRRREQRLVEENRELKAEIRRLERALKEVQAGAATPMMQEMSASWTRRSTRNSAEGSPRESPHGRPHTSDIVGAVMEVCDGNRAVARSKHVAMPSPRRHTGRRLEEEEETLSTVRRRAEKAEANLARMQKLMVFSSSSLLLLRDVFMELRRSGCIVEEGAEARAEVVEGRVQWYGAAKPAKPEASEVLQRVVESFQQALPKMGNLPEVLQALNEEALRSSRPAGIPGPGSSGGSLASSRGLPVVTPRRGKPGHLKGAGLSMQSTVNSSIGELTWSLDSNRTWRCSTK